MNDLIKAASKLPPMSEVRVGVVMQNIGLRESVRQALVEIEPGQSDTYYASGLDVLMAAFARGRPLVGAREADLEKTIKNIVAVGYGGGTPAHRMIKMLDIAEKAELALREQTQVGGIPA